jgi:hypothetical protein
MKHSASLSPSPGPGRPRKEKKKAGIRRVGNYRTKYRPQDLLKALQAVREKRMGAREAAKKLEVPRTTIQDRLSKKSGPSVRCPTELSSAEEEIIMDRLLVMSRWGFPLGRHELAYLIKSYLDG